MLSASWKKQILAVLTVAIVLCSGAFIVPHSDSSATPAVEATGVLG
ncbi:MAG: hypothetical protein AB1782_13075 [Cyanobacteriota bacterium]